MNGVIRTLILNLGTRRRWVVRFITHRFNCEESISVSVESETEWGSNPVWIGRRGEESFDHARNRTTFRRLSTPYAGLYIDHAVRILYIFCVVEKVLRSNERNICDSSLHSIRIKLLVCNPRATLGLILSLYTCPVLRFLDLITKQNVLSQLKTTKRVLKIGRGSTTSHSGKNSLWTSLINNE
jgi:hypothetical protein